MESRKRNNIRYVFWVFCFLLTLQLALSLDIPKATGHVNDYADMLSSSEQQELEQLLRDIEQEGTIEIAILTIASLEDENLEMYANEVFREWGVGKADVNNGLLMLIAAEERKIRIEVGYGLEGVITDATAGLIIRNRISPAFQQGKPGSGLMLAATDIQALASGDPSTISAYEERQNSSGEWIVVLGLMFLYGLGYGLIAKKYKEKKERKKAHQSLSTATFIIAWVMSVFITSSVLWFVLFFILMINITASGGAGFFFLPGGRFGGGGGGFGGFGGGMGGGGGASGGW